MTNYAYRARDSYGGVTEGVLEAETQKEVAVRLGRMGLTPISVSQESAASSLFDTSGFSHMMEQKIKPTELIVYTRQLASILEAGVPLLEGLEAVQEQIRNNRFQEIVAQVRDDIKGGASFSDSLEKHKTVFSALVINMVRAGEKAGILDDVLDRVSNLLEKDQDTGDKIKAATRYPMIIFVTLCLAFIILTTFVIPKFASFFGTFGAELPLPTRILVGFNYVITRYWHVSLVAMAVLVFVFKRVLKTEKGRYNWDNLMLKAPIFGPLFIRINLSRFARMLAAMIRSGIPILEALQIAANTVENKVISKIIMEIRAEVSTGKTISEPMKENKLFPPIAISMVSIGEKAGTLETMLNKVADYFDREASYTIDNLTPLLEPIMILGLACIMMVFALGVFLPMWDLIKVFKDF